MERTVTSEKFAGVFTMDEARSEQHLEAIKSNLIGKTLCEEYAGRKRKLFVIDEVELDNIRLIEMSTNGETLSNCMGSYKLELDKAEHLAHTGGCTEDGHIITLA